MIVHDMALTSPSLATTNKQVVETARGSVAAKNDDDMDIDLDSGAQSRYVC